MEDITAVISTKDRFNTSLPILLTSLINQSIIPKEILLYNDSNDKEWINNNFYQNFIKHCKYKNIYLHFLEGKKKGQIYNHIDSLLQSSYDYLFRIDDDCILSYNTLEILYNSFNNKKIGAVSCSIIDPNFIKLLPNKNWKNKIENIYSEPNCQWFLGNGIVEVDHLYSSFMYKKKSVSNNFKVNLTKHGYREETIFTHEIKKGGWKLLVNYDTVIYHYKNDKGGNRTYNNKLKLINENIFKNKIKEWKTNCNKFNKL